MPVILEHPELYSREPKQPMVRPHLHNYSWMQLLTNPLHTVVLTPASEVEHIKGLCAVLGKTHHVVEEGLYTKEGISLCDDTTSLILSTVNLQKYFNQGGHPKFLARKGVHDLFDVRIYVI